MIKFNITYLTDTELKTIMELLEPIKHKCNIKMTMKNKYKHIYVILK